MCWNQQFPDCGYTVNHSYSGQSHCGGRRKGKHSDQTDRQQMIPWMIIFCCGQQKWMATCKTFSSEITNVCNCVRNNMLRYSKYSWSLCLLNVSQLNDIIYYNNNNNNQNTKFRTWTWFGTKDSSQDCISKTWGLHVIYKTTGLM